MNDFVSSLNFSKMISHVFPGFLFIVSFFMLMDSFCACPGTYTYKIFEGNSLETFIGIIAMFLIIGTIIGVILDGIQNVTIQYFFKKKYLKSKSGKANVEIECIINSILLDKFADGYNISVDNKSKLIKLNKKNRLSMHFYIPMMNSEKFHFINDNYFYYYEFFSNIFLVLLIASPSVFFYAYKALSLSFEHSFYLALFTFISSIICLYVAWVIYTIYQKITLDLKLGSLTEKVMSKV